MLGLEVGGTDDDRHPATRFGEEQRALAGGVAAAGDTTGSPPHCWRSVSVAA